MVLHEGRSNNLSELTAKRLDQALCLSARGSEVHASSDLSSDLYGEFPKSCRYGKDDTTQL